MTTTTTTATAHQTSITQALATMRELTFGVEIETVGISRETAARAVAKAYTSAAATATVSVDHYSGKCSVKLADGREWMCVRDGSLSTSLSCEVVTPICTWADLEMIQAVIRELKRAGARVDSSCGVHVHVGARSLDIPGLVRLAKLVYQQEPLLVAALGVQSHRLSRYTRPVDEAFIQRLATMRLTSQGALAAAWYNGDQNHARSQHYHGSRYHGLNMHSVFYRGTVEFRYFEGTLHAGKVKAYVQLCLALVAKAKNSKGAYARKRTLNASSSKYDLRVFLLRLKMIGDEFATARLHLLEKTAGSSSTNGRGKPEASPAPATTSDGMVYDHMGVPVMTVAELESA